MTGAERHIDYGGRLRATEWVVRVVSIGVARRMVEREHYAHGASNTATYLHGLFRADSAFFDEACLGVAWWIPPTKSAALATFPARWQGVLSLSRLVVAPSVPKNACSFLLSRSMKAIDRAAWPCLVTYADQREGHTGTIYRATNWQFVGETAPEKVFTSAEMIALGAVMVGKSRKLKFVHISKSHAMATG